MSACILTDHEFYGFMGMLVVGWLLIVVGTWIER